MYLTKSIINNNTLFRSIANVDNTQITNNIINNGTSSNSCFESNVIATASGNTIEHNIISQTVPTNYPDNMQVTNISQLFVGTGNFSDNYKLKTNVTDNIALNYATDGKEVGCHGGMFGCPSGGRPQYIPYFTKVVVGQRTEDGKLPVSLEVKIQDE